MSSCLAEEHYAAYVDGELAADEVQRVESHLIQCRSCRALILALQDEASLLTDLLRQRAPAGVPATPARSRVRGLALGLVPSVALGVVIVGVGGWLLERRPPGLSWWDPQNWIGAYEMAFDTIFLLRDALPVVFDLAVAVGATAAMAALLTFLMSALLRRMTGTAAVLLLPALVGLGLAVGPTPSRALDLRWDQRTVEIPRGELLADTLVASAETIDVVGDVEGDLLLLGERITIRGRVDGNVFAAGREVRVTGRIDGSLHTLCDRCILEGEVTGNLYAGAEDVTLAEDGSVGRDAHLFGSGVRVDGRTGRDLTAAGEWIELRGHVGRSASTHSERISVLDEARIGADLRVAIPDHGEADIAPGAAIGGELSERRMERHLEDRSSRWLDAGFYLRIFIFLVSAFLVGLLLHAVLPSLFWGTLETTGDYARCLGVGFLTFVATPIALVLCAISVVGIPIAVLGVFAYLTLLFVSVIVVAALVGSAITGSEPESPHGFGTALLVGLVLLVVLMNLPWVGVVLRLLVGLAGLGLVVTTAQAGWQRRRSALAQ